MNYIDYEYKGWTLRYYLKAPHQSEYFHGKVCWPMTSVFERRCAMCAAPMPDDTQKHFKAWCALVRGTR